MCLLVAQDSYARQNPEQGDNNATGKQSTQLRDPELGAEDYPSMLATARSADIELHSTGHA